MQFHRHLQALRNERGFTAHRALSFQTAIILLLSRRKEQKLCVFSAALGAAELNEFYSHNHRRCAALSITPPLSPPPSDSVSLSLASCLIASIDY